MTESASEALARRFLAGIQAPDERPAPMPPDPGGRLRWVLSRLVDWLVLGLAIANLALVFFDWTYLAMRPRYGWYAPGLVALYDPVKGIEPHRTTEAYLLAAERAFDTPSPQALAEMRKRSTALVQAPPFEAAESLRGLFEQSKRQMRAHTGAGSSSQAFSTFWSKANLGAGRLAGERAWFETRIAPLIGANYYRATGTDGRPFDAFWLLDLCFLPIFALEFLARGAIGVRRGRYPSWKAFCGRRWYDLVYFVPVGVYVVPFAAQGPFHLIRLISVGYRMQRLGLINPVEHLSWPLSALSGLVSDLVMVRLLTNWQDGIARTDPASALASLSPAQRAALVGELGRLAELWVEKAMPAIAPELSAIAARAMSRSLARSEWLGPLAPLLGDWPERLAKEGLSGMQQELEALLADAETRKLAEAIADKLVAAMLDGLAREGLPEAVKHLLIGALEEKKRELLS